MASPQGKVPVQMFHVGREGCQALLHLPLLPQLPLYDFLDEASYSVLLLKGEEGRRVSH